MTVNLKSKEYEIMKFIWENEIHGLTFGEIHEYANNLGKELSRQRLNCYLQTLIEKGFIKAEGEDRRKIYSPIIAKQDYDNKIANHVLDSMFDGSLKSFISALTGGQSLSEKSVKELKAIFKKMG